MKQPTEFVPEAANDEDLGQFSLDDISPADKRKWLDAYNDAYGTNDD